jgi:hypothetical protein
MSALNDNDTRIERVETEIAVRITATVCEVNGSRYVSLREAEPGAFRAAFEPAVEQRVAERFAIIIHRAILRRLAEAFRPEGPLRQRVTPPPAPTPSQRKKKGALIQ